jgi:hypothetical protein
MFSAGLFLNDAGLDMRDVAPIAASDRQTDMFLLGQPMVW